MNDIKKEELITILKYAYFMAKVVSPISAKQVGLYNCDGAICDFYRFIVERLEKNEKIDITNDEFLGLVYKDMKKDIANRNIEYDGFFFATIEEYDLEK